MTTIPLNCEGFAEALADYLERDDSPRIRGAVEAHAASCADCGALLSDLQQMRVDASGLPTLTPSRDLWEGIAARIEAPVVSLDKVRGQKSDVLDPRSKVRGLPTWLRPAAAAAALVLITAGVTYFATREAILSNAQVAVGLTDGSELNPQQIATAAFDSARRAESLFVDRGSRASDLRPRTDDDAGPAVRTPSARTPRSTEAVAVPVANNPLTATLEAVYGQEIARLRRIIDERRGMLDTATVGVIERNLTIIDKAIGESRAALARDPASAFLNEQLNSALEQKVELLRAAALLPVRS